MDRLWIRLLLPFFLATIVIPAQLAKTLKAPLVPIQELQATVHEFQQALEINHPVQVIIVPVDPHLASSQRTEQGFVISFDEAFLATLGPAERRAVLAHEMGHVWISTHHPYLQTEKLANRQALKLVSPEILNRVYQKVEGHSSPSPERQGSAARQAGKISR